MFHESEKHRQEREAGLAAMKPGDEVYVEYSYGSGKLGKVLKRTPATLLVQVGALELRFNSRTGREKKDGYHKCEVYPVTQEHRDAVEKVELLRTINAIHAGEWKKLHLGQLRLICAVLVKKPDVSGERAKLEKLLEERRGDAEAEGYPVGALDMLDWLTGTGAAPSDKVC